MSNILVSVIANIIVHVVNSVIVAKIKPGYTSVNCNSMILFTNRHLPFMISCRNLVVFKRFTADKHHFLLIDDHIHFCIIVNQYLHLTHESMMTKVTVLYFVVLFH